MPAARRHAQPSVQIGVIEVKVLPPAPQATGTPVPAAPAPMRMARRVVTPSGGLARGYGAFGLMQS
ncbi:hypothetical protein [Bradyrhizobium sp. CCBAU 11386]|uniref:hypothetical protein n=1 Tax=Bradyrhizobium sp. CCBAU 11386 TaxID=1630837 RepID=UPI002304AB92|nr:hypothetical protein [Bradyrhizobium sp. CCBAU 11386]